MLSVVMTTADPRAFTTPLLIGTARADTGGGGDRREWKCQDGTESINGLKDLKKMVAFVKQFVVSLMLKNYCINSDLNGE